MSPDTGRHRATTTTSSATLSTSQFKRELAGLLSAVADEHGLNWRSPTARGRAFEYWVAQLIADFESGFDGELSEVVMGSQDLGADLVFEDVGNRLLLICQCKYRRPHDELAEADVNDFFHRHAHYQDRTWVMAYGSDAAASALCDYGERIRAGWKVEYRFITTARASARVRELARRCDDRYRAQGEPLRCVLYDFSAPKEYYLRSRSIAQAIPERVELDLPEGQWFEKSGPCKTIVAAVKGNTVRNLALQHRHALYAVNIRGYLGNRGINHEIAQTAVTQPANFFYFNNGVSAICTRFEITGNHLVAPTSR